MVLYPAAAGYVASACNPIVVSVANSSTQQTSIQMASQKSPQDTRVNSDALNYFIRGRSGEFPENVWIVDIWHLGFEICSFSQQPAQHNRHLYFEVLFLNQARLYPHVYKMETWDP